jgi:hypothetical protein
MFVNERLTTGAVAERVQNDLFPLHLSVTFYFRNE